MCWIYEVVCNFCEQPMKSLSLKPCELAPIHNRLCPEPEWYGNHFPSDIAAADGYIALHVKCKTQGFAMTYNAREALTVQDVLAIQPHVATIIVKRTGVAHKACRDQAIMLKTALAPFQVPGSDTCSDVEKLLPRISREVPALPAMLPVDPERLRQAVLDGVVLRDLPERDTSPLGTRGSRILHSPWDIIVQGPEKKIFRLDDGRALIFMDETRLAGVDGPKGLYAAPIELIQCLFLDNLDVVAAARQEHTHGHVVDPMENLWNDRRPE